MKNLLPIILCLALTSCGISRSQGNSVSSVGASTHLEITVFQTLSKTSALALAGHDVVRIEPSEMLLYDGLKLSGTFVLLDTYTYEAKNEQINTVPVYIKRSEYIRLTKQKAKETPSGYSL